MIHKQVSKSVYIEQTHKTHTDSWEGTGKFTAAFFFGMRLILVFPLRGNKT